MSDGPEKRRKKNADAEQPSDSKSSRRREKKESPSEPIEAATIVDSKRKPKRAKKVEKDDVLEHVEIDMPVVNDTPPRKPKKKEQKIQVEKVDPKDLDTSDEEEARSRANEKKKPSKANNLKVSRKWDQEDLEVVVPEDELSDEGPNEGSDEGEGHNRRTGPTPILDQEDVLLMSDDEKANLDWLTRVMPDEVLRNIYSHLEPPAVDGTALVCHRLNNTIQERDIWAVYKPEWGYVTDDRFARARSRAGFAACYNHEMSERKKAADRKEEAEWRTYLEEGSEWAKGFMTLFLFNRSVDYFSLFCFILGTCFAAARAQEAVTWNWRIVLIPFYIPMLQMWLTPLAYDLSRIYFTSDNINEVTESLTIWHAIIAKYRQIRAVLYCFNFAFVVFFILLMIKLNDNLNGIPAGVTIIPWLLLLVICIEECTVGFMIGESYNESQYSVDRFIFCGASLISIPWLIMMVLKMDGVVTANWVVVLIPFYVLCVWWLFVPGFLFILYPCWYSLRDYSRLSDRGSGGTAFFVWLMISAMATVPFLTWAILVALNLDGYFHRSWPVVFIPLFVGEGLLFFGCLFTDFIVWLD